MHPRERDYYSYSSRMDANLGLSAAYHFAHLQIHLFLAAFTRDGWEDEIRDIGSQRSVPRPQCEHVVQHWSQQADHTAAASHYCGYEGGFSSIVAFDVRVRTNSQLAVVVGLLLRELDSYERKKRGLQQNSVPRLKGMLKPITESECLSCSVHTRNAFLSGS